MFGWFKRQPEPVKPRKAAAPTSSRSSSARSLWLGDAPPPLPQVVSEGNSQADWSEWENSMMELDSQMGEVPVSQSIYERDGRHTIPAPLAENDTYGNITKNRDM